MESKFNLTPLALDVFEAIKQAGGHVYLVGGCVRDFLLKRRSMKKSITCTGKKI